MDHWKSLSGLVAFVEAVLIQRRGSAERVVSKRELTGSIERSFLNGCSEFSDDWNGELRGERKRNREKGRENTIKMVRVFRRLETDSTWPVVASRSTDVRTIEFRYGSENRP
jgi:hypothetical protein